MWCESCGFLWGHVLNKGWPCFFLFSFVFLSFFFSRVFIFLFLFRFFLFSVFVCLSNFLGMFPLCFYFSILLSFLFSLYLYVWLSLYICLSVCLSVFLLLLLYPTPHTYQYLWGSKWITASWGMWLISHEVSADSWVMSLVPGLLSYEVVINEAEHMIFEL